MKIYILERDNFNERPDPQIFLNGNEAYETIRKEFKSKLAELGISDEFTEDEMETDNGYFHCWFMNNLSQCGDCMISDTFGSDEWLWRITEHDIPSTSEKLSYKVKYEDSTGNDNRITTYNTEEDAEKAIEEELENCKEWMQSKGYDYNDFGSTTEIWVPGGNEYASWDRLWK